MSDELIHAAFFISKNRIGTSNGFEALSNANSSTQTGKTAYVLAGFGDVSIENYRVEPFTIQEIKSLYGIDPRVMDIIFMYVASHPMRDRDLLGAFPIAASDLKTLPTTRLVFVMANPLYGNREAVLRAVGHEEARVVESEAGGSNTLERLIEEYFS